MINKGHKGRRFSWSEHISRKFSQGMLGTKQPLLSILRRHGFNLE